MGNSMNEKIKQLALDAGIGFTLWDDSGREMIDNYTPEEYLEKFAELIVRECLDIAQDRAAFDGFPPNDVNHIIDEIKEHFGVEE